jgi:hypothetical protein
MIKVKYQVLAVEDSHGNWDAVVCDDMSDCVQICGMKEYVGLCPDMRHERRGW